MNTKAVSFALRSKIVSELANLGFDVTSTARQLSNGTLMFTYTPDLGQPISYILTGSGVVIGNKFSIDKIYESDYKKMYKAGLARILGLARKRLAID